MQRDLQTIGDWSGLFNARTARRMIRHPAAMGHKFGRDYVRGLGAASDAGGTGSNTGVQTTPDLIASAQDLLTYMSQSGVPYELLADAKVQSFQAFYVNAGNTLPASAHAANGVDGLYGPNTAAALAATLGTNVPAPNLTPPSPGVVPAPPSPVVPAPPSPGPSPKPSPASGSSHSWLWLALLGAGGYFGYRAYKKRKRTANPCHRCLGRR